MNTLNTVVRAHMRHDLHAGVNVCDLCHFSRDQERGGAEVRLLQSAAVRLDSGEGCAAVGCGEEVPLQCAGAVVGCGEGVLLLGAGAAGCAGGPCSRPVAADCSAGLCSKHAVATEDMHTTRRMHLERIVVGQGTVTSARASYTGC